MHDSAGCVLCLSSLGLFADYSLSFLALCFACRVLCKEYYIIYIYYYFIIQRSQSLNVRNEITFVYFQVYSNIWPVWNSFNNGSINT